MKPAIAGHEAESGDERVGELARRRRLHPRRSGQSCPVRTPCLAWALEHGVAAGVWGGATEEERRAMRRSLMTNTSGA
jgi:hypothetical protein